MTISVTFTRSEFLPDYCPRCNPLGHHADRCTRDASLTTPISVTPRGTKQLVCRYECAECGHGWTRRNLWTQEAA